ncbi:hypothetical protein EKN56_14795 [Limnobaculum zhutongyuii]|uniref:Uncharacterized protein n=1 Tax=Limnobaculum zhutongyuii TaxID=2498113 RepID=A0A411WN23_9GAMM|nr:hypothetical protein [Limnobaculum zhutongyuii]QBH97557.1 hypothetical protein EKN56_14795 [Limnobaculum zhutongyuii]TQS91031.1 hypothetical protein ELQ32_01515 [Limnobaculum zhutongyuii]
MLNLIDSTPGDPLELAEQCLALATVVLKINEAAVKESLQFILHEKMEALFQALDNAESSV